MARSLGPRVQETQLTFTSSGSEANQLAIRARLEPLCLRGEKPHWILSAGEHDASLQMVEWFRARGGTVSFLPLDAQGRPQIEQLDSLWEERTALVSCVWVNNETGVITDVQALARETQARGVPLHLDGAQAWGKLPVDLDACGASCVSFSGHKIGALAGTGVLWARTSASEFLPKSASTVLGKQEAGHRGGTENLLGLVTLGAAAAELDPIAWEKQIAPIRDFLEREVLATIEGVRIHGAGAARVANTINFGFEGIDKDGLVMALDLAGYAVSSGSACSSGITEPSHVLRAMGLSAGPAQAAVRVSLSAANTLDEVQGFALALRTAVARQRGTRS